jgi:hypothetical protein
VAEPDALAGDDPVDAQPLGGERAEHGDRCPRGRGVEEAAVREVSPVAWSRPGRAAWTVSASVSIGGMSGVRYTVTLRT